ncbi:CpaD family pilus assembly protein [Pacificibacter marinus]|nr:CpaD family pilus assembly protein [Pacificibacter marinus]
MRMNKTKFILAGLAVFLVAGCERLTPATGVTERLSAPYVEAQHQYRFASGSSALSAQERGRISAFLNALVLDAGDVLLVSIPSVGKSSIDMERLGAMHSILARYPAKKQYLQDNNFSTRPSPNRQVGIIRVTRAQGLSVSCQSGVADLGCANAINLAVMIHEPGDVLEPDTTATMSYRDRVGQ